MRGKDNWIAWALFLPIFIIMFNALTNPAYNILLNTTKGITGVTTPDCQSYKNEIDQKQTDIERLNKDLSDCNNRNPSGFSILELVVGILIGAAIVLYWFIGHERQLREEIERLKKRPYTRNK